MDLELFLSYARLYTASFTVIQHGVEVAVAMVGAGQQVSQRPRVSLSKTTDIYIMQGI